MTDDIVLGGKQFPNPRKIKPVLDTDIPPRPKDWSSPKPGYGFAYFAEPYEYKNQPVKKSIQNAPLHNPVIPEKPPRKRYGKLHRLKRSN